MSENSKSNLTWLPDSWTPEERVMAVWFGASIVFMLFFMILSMFSGFIGGFSVFMSMVSALSAIVSVATIIMYELHGKRMDF